MFLIVNKVASLTPFVSFLIQLFVWGTIGCALYFILSRRLFQHKKKITTWVSKTMSMFVIYLLLKIFFFDIYRVSGRSMAPTLIDGDYVLVLKAHYGTRIPRSLYEIPWLNLLTYLYPFNLLNHESSRQYRRLHSNQTVMRGDIVVFNIPVYQKQFGVKRCTSIPGDTIFDYNGMNMGVLPQLYYNANTGDSLSSIEHRILTHYTVIPQPHFSHSYYFVEGDNKNHSTDSRTWGAVQDDHIVGKAGFIIFSKATDGTFRWERFLKKLR